MLKIPDVDCRILLLHLYSHLQFKFCNDAWERRSYSVVIHTLYSDYIVKYAQFLL